MVRRVPALRGLVQLDDLPDAGVEGEAIDDGAATGLFERLGIPQAPVHLGGLQGGEGVGLRLDVVVEADQDLCGPPDDASEDRSHVLVAWLRYGEEMSWTVALGDEHAIGDQGVEVDVPVERSAGALAGGDAAGPRFGRTEA